VCFWLIQHVSAIAASSGGVWDVVNEGKSSWWHLLYVEEKFINYYVELIRFCLYEGCSNSKMFFFSN
jgi:hypothetical protein